MVELKIQCPTCKHQILVRGKPSEKIIITCPQCNTRGEFTFPLDASTAPVQNEPDTQRPLGVTILAILAIFYASTNIFKLLFSASLLNLASPLNSLNLIPPLLLLLDIVVSAVFFVIAYAFWKGLQWSWFVAIILLVIEIVLQISVPLSLAIFLKTPFSGFFYYLLIIYAVVFVVIFSLILFYLTRPHVKTYFHVGHRGDFKSIIRAKRKIVYGLVIILIMTSIIVVLGFQSTGTISLKSVQTQENPREPGDMTITAELTGGSPFGRVNASLFYATYFGEGSESGSETMQPMGMNRYSAILHGSNGSEIWCVIESGNIVLGERTFQEGHVERSSRTSLAITNITQTPETPTTQTMSITITVHVTSNATITDVMFIKEFIAPSGYNGSSDSDMQKINNDTYSETIYASGAEGFDTGFSGENPQGTFVSGTTIYYRIAAKDASGNTAVQTKHITIK